MFWKVAQNVIDMTEIIDGDEQSPTITQDHLSLMVIINTYITRFVDQFLQALSS